MASQTDNITLNDDTTGLIRTVDPALDDIFLSVDVTLQSGAIFEADNIKRGTGDPNAGGGTPGNEGDIYQRTGAGVGELYVNTDGTNTGWQSAAGGGDDLATVLVNGNTTGGTDIEISNGDSIVGEDNAAGDGYDVTIVGGNSTGAGPNAGGDIILTPGLGSGGGADGVVSVNGTQHYADSATDPTAPTPADGDRYYNTALDMEMRYDATRAKWLSVESSVFHGGDKGNVISGGYLHTAGDVTFSATNGYPALFDGTVVAFGYTRDDTDSADFAVTGDGSSIYTLNSTAISGYDTTANANFSQGDILGIRNDGPNTLTDPIVWVRVKWRV